VQGAPLRHPKSDAGAGADAGSGPYYLRPIILVLRDQVRLPKLVPRPGAIAAACPSCAHPLAVVLVQGAPLRHPKSVAGAGADAAIGSPYHRPSNLPLEALMRLLKLVPRAGAIAAARPPCAHLMAGIFMQGAPLRHPKSVAGAGDDAAIGPPYIRPIILVLRAQVRLPKLVPIPGTIAAACPPCAHPLAGVLMQGAPLRHPKSVAGAGDDAATGPPYLRPTAPS